MESRIFIRETTLDENRLHCFASMFLDPFVFQITWRKRVGVEPTEDGANPPPAGFEDRESHRTPCASGNQWSVVSGRLSV